VATSLVFIQDKASLAYSTYRLIPCQLNILLPFLFFELLFEKSKINLFSIEDEYFVHVFDVTRKASCISYSHTFLINDHLEIFRFT